MVQAVEAYRQVSVSDEFKELERLRSKARHDEAQALAHAAREAKLENSIQIAKKLMGRGMSVEDIAEDTGLTVDEVLRL
jgi:predicted transposase/invertase (TIGR01784 family)